MSSDDTRGRIIDAAGEVFAEKGFRAGTIREICRRAGVNLASVNYYFGDKEHLYIEAFKLAHPAGPEPNLAQDWPDGALPNEKLRAFIHEMFKRLLRVESPAWQMRLLQREILEPTPFCMDVMREYFLAKSTHLMSVLDEVLPPEMPLYRRHQIGFSIIGQCVYFRAASPVIRMVIGEREQSEHHTVESLTDHVCEFVLAGLGLAPPLGKTAGDDNRLDFSRTDQAAAFTPQRKHESFVDEQEQDRVKP
ncbi:MAG: CerR family C-terminal domain-containing protein [Pirellulales bacterium]|nr:CerR family C-terminal domain-containing protein [Pirellulales bacterium]